MPDSARKLIRERKPEQRRGHTATLEGQGERNLLVEAIFEREREQEAEERRRQRNGTT